MGDPKCEENHGWQSHKVYISHEEYTIQEELDSLSNIPEDAEI